MPRAAPIQAVTLARMSRKPPCWEAIVSSSRRKTWAIAEKKTRLSLDLLPIYEIITSPNPDNVSFLLHRQAVLRELLKYFLLLGHEHNFPAVDRAHILIQFPVLLSPIMHIVYS